MLLAGAPTVSPANPSPRGRGSSAPSVLASRKRPETIGPSVLPRVRGPISVESQPLSLWGGVVTFCWSRVWNIRESPERGAGTRGAAKGQGAGPLLPESSRPGQGPQSRPHGLNDTPRVLFARRAARLGVPPGGARGQKAPSRVGEGRGGSRVNQRSRPPRDLPPPHTP